MEELIKKFDSMFITLLSIQKEQGQILAVQKHLCTKVDNMARINERQTSQISSNSEQIHTQTSKCDTCIETLNQHVQVLYQNQDAAKIELYGNDKKSGLKQRVDLIELRTKQIYKAAFTICCGGAALLYANGNDLWQALKRFIL